jgi:NADPH:quinone reductase
VRNSQIVSKCTSKETILKAVEIRAFGSPEGLAVIDLPDPSPADGQVLIATEAIGVGGVDAVIRSGAIAGYGFKQGHILGSEVAGTVNAVGGGVDTSWVGQRVWAFTGLGGGYVEQAIAPVKEILPLPANLSAVDAVTLGSSGVVAHFGLAHARFAPGESVLVRGAGSSRRQVAAGGRSTAG